MSFYIDMDVAILNNPNKHNDEYTERHHVVPKCVGGPVSFKYTVELSAREHFIIHWLLCKIYSNTPHIHKLASAFNNMCMSSDNQCRSRARGYKLAREYFSRHHPTKQPEVN